VGQGTTCNGFWLHSIVGSRGQCKQLIVRIRRTSDEELPAAQEGVLSKELVQFKSRKRCDGGKTDAGAEQPLWHPSVQKSSVVPQNPY